MSSSPATIEDSLAKAILAALPKARLSFLSNGLFSQLLFAEAGDESWIIKAAATGVSAPGPCGSAAFLFHTGTISAGNPDPFSLLEIQYNWLTTASKWNHFTPTHFTRTEDCCFYAIPRLPGPSMRQALNQRVVNTEHLRQLLSTIGFLASEPHGDIKPDNLVLGQGRITVIDPGFNGFIDCLEGEEMQCIVTSAGYYPKLDSDDRFAIGCCIWEAIMGFHPLDSTFADHADGEIGAKLAELIRFKSLVGHWQATALSLLRPPSSYKKDLPPIVEKLLLSALGLTVAGSVIDLAPAPESQESLLADLAEIEKLQIKLPQC